MERYKSKTDKCNLAQLHWSARSDGNIIRAAIQTKQSHKRSIRTQRQITNRPSKCNTDAYEMRGYKCTKMYLYDLEVIIGMICSSFTHSLNYSLRWRSTQTSCHDIIHACADAAFDVPMASDGTDVMETQAIAQSTQCQAVSSEVVGAAANSCWHGMGSLAVPICPQPMMPTDMSLVMLLKQRTWWLWVPRRSSILVTLRDSRASCSNS